MPEGNDYHALQREQNERIKSLETKVEDLEEDNKRLMGEETERLKGRIRQLEKWVAGAGAVIAVAMAGLGLVEVTDFGFAKTAKQVEEHREYFTNILHPAMSRSNWLGENYSDMTGKEPPEWIKKK
jgi:predicted AAA+ superfamily ATPase|tara:strand:+ start:67 stop:444 length:378 start_codon:yes stop_codon:yes gene_type:complete